MTVIEHSNMGLVAYINTRLGFGQQRRCWHEIMTKADTLWAISNEFSTQSYLDECFVRVVMSVFLHVGDVARPPKKKKKKWKKKEEK